MNFYVTLREEDKNIFDFCRENNIDHISKAIGSQKVDVNTKDEEVTSVLEIISETVLAACESCSLQYNLKDCYHDNAVLPTISCMLRDRSTIGKYFFFHRRIQQPTSESIHPAEVI